MRAQAQPLRDGPAAGPIEGGGTKMDIARRPSRSSVATIGACLVFSLIYVSIPWPSIFENIYHYPMIDRRVYTAQVLRSNDIIDLSKYYTSISYFSNEYLWHVLIRFLNRAVGLGPEAIFWCMSLITIFAFSLTVARAVGLSFVIFLLNPLIVDLAFSQLRISVAASLAMLLASFYLNRPMRAFAVAAALSMLHTGSILFFFVGGVAKWAAAKTSWVRSYLGLLPLFVIGVMISILIGPARETVLGLVRDRRATYQDMSSTGLYLTFWIGLLCVLAFRWKAIANRFEIAFAITILSLVAGNLVTGGYSTRFIAVAFPFLIISMASLDGIYRSAVLSLFCFYALYQWLYWLRFLG